MVFPKVNKSLSFFQDPVFLFHSIPQPIAVSQKFDPSHYFPFKDETFECHLRNLKPVSGNIPIAVSILSINDATCSKFLPPAIGSST